MYVFGPYTLTTKQALYGPLSITMANLLCPLSNSNSCCPVLMQLRDNVYGVIVRTISITSRIASATSEFWPFFKQQMANSPTHTLAAIHRALICFIFTHLMTQQVAIRLSCTHYSCQDLYNIIVNAYMYKLIILRLFVNL